MVFLILYLIAILIADSISDWYLIEVRKKPINHLRGSILFTLAVGIGLAVDLLSWLSYGALWLQYILTRSSILILIPSIRWILHDYLLNKFRGLSPEYLGQGPGSAQSDRFLRYIWNRYSLKPGIVKAVAIIISLMIAGLLNLNLFLL